MRAYLLVLVLLASAGAAAADGVLERGDVVLRLAIEGGFIGPIPPDILMFFDDRGVGKNLAFPKLNGITDVLAPDAARVIITSSSRFIFIVKDGSAVEFIRDVFLQSPGEIVPMRSGGFVVAESVAAHTKPRIVQIDADGRIVREGSLIDVPADGVFSFGVAHMELLADQCTVLWNSNNGGLARFRTILFAYTGSTSAPARHFRISSPFHPTPSPARCACFRAGICWLRRAMKSADTT